MKEKRLKTQCNYEVLRSCCDRLGKIVANLNSAYEMAEKLLAAFDEAYEGDAKPEVDMFLASLPIHIYRLELFYSKMLFFVWATIMSFEENDTQMTKNMEG